MTVQIARDHLQGNINCVQIYFCRVHRDPHATEPYQCSTVARVLFTLKTEEKSVPWPAGRSHRILCLVTYVKNKWKKQSLISLVTYFVVLGHLRPHPTTMARQATPTPTRKADVLLAQSLFTDVRPIHSSQTTRVYRSLALRSGQSALHFHQHRRKQCGLPEYVIISFSTPYPYPNARYPSPNSEFPTGVLTLAATVNVTRRIRATSEMDATEFVNCWPVLLVLKIFLSDDNELPRKRSTWRRWLQGSHSELVAAVTSIFQES